jgi:hypothetical protein
MQAPANHVSAATLFLERHVSYHCLAAVRHHAWVARQRAFCIRGRLARDCRTPRSSQHATSRRTCTYTIRCAQSRWRPGHHAWWQQRRSRLGARRFRSRLRGGFHRVRNATLPRIFCLNTRKGLASNPKFLLLTLRLQSISVDRDFVAHMFTSCHCVADSVPADSRESEHCKVSSDGLRIYADALDNRPASKYDSRKQLFEDRSEYPIDSQACAAAIKVIL